MGTRLQLGVLACSLASLAACAGGEAAATGPAPAPSAAPRVVEPADQSAPVDAKPTTPKAVPAAERLEVEVDGHAITLWAKAAESPRRAIVLIHGRTWSGRPDFDLQVPGESLSLMDALVAEGFAAYAVDLRGYGGTARDDSRWLTPDRARDDVLAVLGDVRGRHPDLEPPALLGWSLGSMVAQLTVQEGPDLVSAVVLYGYPRDPDRVGGGGPVETSPPPRKATTAKAAASDFITPGSISDRAAHAFVEQALAADPVRMDWTGGDQWGALRPEAVRVPTLVIHGERDPYAPHEAQAKLFTRLGHQDRWWVVLRGCDHAAHLERCHRRFVQAVSAFVLDPAPVSE